MYHVRKKKLKLTPQLQELTSECGRIYSKTLVEFWRVQRKKGIWLSKYTMQRWMKEFRGDVVYSQTAQACVDSFFNSLKAWRGLRKAGFKSARPPKRRRRDFKIQYKGQCLKIRDGYLLLPNAKGTKPIRIKWDHELPCLVTIRKVDNHAELVACYKQSNAPKIETGRTIALDLGQIHLATTSDGWSVNGRKLRSLRRYQNKYKAQMSRLQSKKQKYSKAWIRLHKTKRKTLTKLNNQISDFTHKATTGIVNTLHRTSCKTLVIGELCGLRENNDSGKVRNQENHQWNFGKLTWQLTYKAEGLGMEVKLQNEAYSSSTCPCCGTITKTKTRRFVCSSCGFEAHRDILGAKNILKKYLEIHEEFHVVGGMAPPFGVRLKPHSSVADGFKFKGIGFKDSETTGVLTPVECHKCVN